MAGLLTAARRAFHERLLQEILFYDNKAPADDDIATHADSNSPLSKMFGKGQLRAIGQARRDKRPKGQTSGAKFAEIVRWFIEETFPRLQHLRPGDWQIVSARQNDDLVIANYHQFSHLRQIDNLAKKNIDVAVTVGQDYVVTPDVLIVREALKDASLNTSDLEVVDDQWPKNADIRASNQPLPSLHASISTKWTLRSDRAQNARTEALNLIRNRKGHLPHFVLVTAEPLPSRLASAALGTGDIDCVYQIALPELQMAVTSSDADAEVSGSSRLKATLAEERRLLKMMVEGRRLKDIADLPLDLAV